MIKWSNLFGYNGKVETRYSEEDVQQIREVLSGRLPSPTPSLYKKISKDKRAKQFLVYGFFPEVFDLVYGSEASPEISFDGGSRGQIAILLHPSRRIVIKRIQNSREHEVAQIADELGTGPKQYPTIEGYLTEGFIDGPLFSRLDLKEPERAYSIGTRVGEILSLLHQNDIFYNDAILMDPLGKSHLVVPETSPAILIDYGVSIRLNNFPRLSDEEIINFFKTMPGGNLLIALGMGERDTFLQKLREELPPKKEHVMAIDIYRLYEQLSVVERRFGYPTVDMIAKGVEASYQFQKK